MLSRTEGGMRAYTRIIRLTNTGTQVASGVVRLLEFQEALHARFEVARYRIRSGFRLDATQVHSVIVRVDDVEIAEHKGDAPVIGHRSPSDHVDDPTLRRDRRRGLQTSTLR